MRQTRRCSERFLRAHSGLLGTVILTELEIYVCVCKNRGDKDLVSLLQQYDTSQRPAEKAAWLAHKLGLRERTDDTRYVFNSAHSIETSQRQLSSCHEVIPRHN